MDDNPKLKKQKYLLQQYLATNGKSLNFCKCAVQYSSNDYFILARLRQRWASQLTKMFAN